MKLGPWNIHLIVARPKDRRELIRLTTNGVPKGRVRLSIVGPEKHPVIPERALVDVVEKSPYRQAPKPKYTSAWISGTDCYVVPGRVLDLAHTAPTERIKVTPREREYIDRLAAAAAKENLRQRSGADASD